MLSGCSASVAAVRTGLSTRRFSCAPGTRRQMGDLRLKSSLPSQMRLSLALLAVEVHSTVRANRRQTVAYRGPSR